MAQALFKSWVVDFDPVIDNALAAGNPIPEPLHAKAEVRAALGDKRKPLPEAIQKQFPSSFAFSEEMGWIPEGWNPVKLGDYVTVKRGGSPRPIHDYLVDEGLPWVKISDATASSSRYLMGTKQFIKPEGLKKTVMLKKGELILSNSATPGLPMFLNLDACIHDGWLFFPEKKLFGDLYLYQLFLVVRSELMMQGNGSVFTNLKTDILKNHLVVMPGESLLKEIESQLYVFHRRSLLVQKETDSLVGTRDTLLPQLLSGQLRIPDVGKLVAEVV
jgi:type I restriction enzyme S subunit